jgi:hypothetical protein
LPAHLKNHERHCQMQQAPHRSTLWVGPSLVCYAECCFFGWAAISALPLRDRTENIYHSRMEFLPILDRRTYCLYRNTISLSNSIAMTTPKRCDSATKCRWQQSTVKSLPRPVLEVFSCNWLPLTLAEDTLDGQLGTIYSIPVTYYFASNMNAERAFGLPLHHKRWVSP